MDEAAEGIRLPAQPTERVVRLCQADSINGATHYSTQLVVPVCDEVVGERAIDAEQAGGPQLRGGRHGVVGIPCEPGAVRDRRQSVVDGVVCEADAWSRLYGVRVRDLLPVVVQEVLDLRSLLLGVAEPQKAACRILIGEDGVASVGSNNSRRPSLDVGLPCRDVATRIGDPLEGSTGAPLHGDGSIEGVRGCYGATQGIVDDV